MSSTRITLARAAVYALGAITLTAASPAPASRGAAFGPPWISIEYPANPLDQSTRGAFLLVHAFHHGTPVQAPVRGTAEGIVNGERKSVALRFETTSRPGVYALRKQWSDGVVQGEEGQAQALVEIGADGAITSVQVPTRREREWTIPRKITAQEIEESL